MASAIASALGGSRPGRCTSLAGAGAVPFCRCPVRTALGSVQLAPCAAIDLWLHAAPACESAAEAAGVCVAYRGSNLGEVGIGGREHTTCRLVADLIHEGGVAGPRVLEPPLQCANRHFQAPRRAGNRRVSSRQQNHNRRPHGSWCQRIGNSHRQLLPREAWWLGRPSAGVRDHPHSEGRRDCASGHLVPWRSDAGTLPARERGMPLLARGVGRERIRNDYTTYGKCLTSEFLKF